MEKIQLTHWRGKLLDEMSKEQLIETLTDSHHLWREANERGIQDVVNITKGMAQPKMTEDVVLMGFVIGCLVIFIIGALLLS